MWIFKRLFEWFAKFFQSKPGKTTAKLMMGVGIGATAGAGVEMAVADKRNKCAERIKANAIKKHDEGRAKVESTLADLGETKLAIYKSFGELADAIESIQQRPDYEFSIEGIELPDFKPAEFKQLAKGIEVAVGGVGGVAAGSAIGIAIMGTGSILALSPGALLGGVVLCKVGAKRLRQSAENVKTAKKIQHDVEIILKYYKELDETAKRFHKTFRKMQKSYFQYTRKVKKIVARKTDWEKFSKVERLSVKNAIKLSQLLYYMCSIQLMDASKADTLEKVNTSEINQAITAADTICKQLKEDVAV